MDAETIKSIGENIVLPIVSGAVGITAIIMLFRD